MRAYLRLDMVELAQQWGRRLSAWTALQNYFAGDALELCLYPELGLDDATPIRVDVVVHEPATVRPISKGKLKLVVSLDETPSISILQAFPTWVVHKDGAVDTYTPTEILRMAPETVLLLPNEAFPAGLCGRDLRRT